MELPKAARKEYSHSGAIKCRVPSDPRHYTCPIHNESYFDPSNWVYAVTMRLMMPKMMLEVGWNKGTKGDIFESILGLHYLVANGLVKGYVGALSKHIGTVSAIFECFVWHTWRLVEAIGQHDTDRVVLWVSWIIDMVAYRQRKDDHIGHALALPSIPTMGTTQQVMYVRRRELHAPPRQRLPRYQTRAAGVR